MLSRKFKARLFTVWHATDSDGGRIEFAIPLALSTIAALPTLKNRVHALAMEPDRVLRELVPLLS